MTERDTLKNIRRKLCQANPGWPRPFVHGFVDGWLDALDGCGPQLRSVQQPDSRLRGHDAAYRRYSARAALAQTEGGTA